MVEALLGGTGIPAGIRGADHLGGRGQPAVRGAVRGDAHRGRHPAARRGRLARGRRGRRSQVPPTINALLAARLDRLGRDERDGPRAGRRSWGSSSSEQRSDGCAARPSRRVSRHASAASSGASSSTSRRRNRRGEVSTASITSSSVTRRTPACSSGAARSSTSGSWSGRMRRHAAGELVLEFEEILGWHLEQAHRYRAELSPFDEHGVALGIRASERLAVAGRRAEARGDMPATANLLSRAARARPVGDPLRPALSADAAEALIEVGELDEADGSLYETARSEADAAGHRTLATIATLGHVNLHYLTEVATQPAVARRSRRPSTTLETAERPCRPRAGMAHPDQHPLRELRLLGRDDVGGADDRAGAAGGRPADGAARAARRSRRAPSSARPRCPRPSASSRACWPSSRATGRRRPIRCVRSPTWRRCVAGSTRHGRSTRRAGRPSTTSAGGSTRRSRRPSRRGPSSSSRATRRPLSASCARTTRRCPRWASATTSRPPSAFLAEALYRQGRDDEALG